MKNRKKISKFKKIEQAERVKKGKKNQICYAVISTLVFCSLAAISFCFSDAKQQKIVYPMVCLGDSILGQVRDETSITNILEEKLGIEIFNGALGGTNMSRADRKHRMGFPKDGLSMTALALAIGYKDFGVQKTIQVQDTGTEYFKETLEELEKIDFSQVEILLIEHGVNDYNAGIPIENKENSYDIYSYAGAVRTAVTTLQKQYPQLRIILVSPTYSWFLAMETTCEEQDFGQGYLKDYVEMQQAVASELGVEFIDNYHFLYPHEKWEDWQIYTIDGLHPNEDGRRLIAEKLAEYLENSVF